jgi:hypothetical protein
MRDFILKVYIKVKIAIRNLQMLYNIYLLGRYLYEERVFHNGKPEDVLKVIQKFTENAWSEYPDKVRMNRTPVQSAALLGVLVRKYYETYSDIILDQILEVLKNEFIKRESNGRK